MKVNLLIYGQLRTFFHCFHSIKKNLINRMDVEIYISSWNQTGIKKRPYVQEKDIYNLSSNIADVRLHEFKTSYFESLQGVKLPPLVKQHDHQFWRANLPLFFLMNEAKKIFEYKNSHPSADDIFIFSRADNLFRENMVKYIEKNIGKPQEKVIYGFKNDRDNVVCDQVMIGSNSILPALSVFENLNDYWISMENKFKENKKLAWGEVLSCERMLYHHCNNQGLERCVVPKSHKIVRETDLFKNLLFLNAGRNLRKFLTLGK